MPNTTNRVKLPYILQSQSQKEVTHNASLDLIDALLQAAMVSVGVNIQTSARPRARATSLLTNHALR